MISLSKPLSQLNNSSPIAEGVQTSEVEQKTQIVASQSIKDSNSLQGLSGAEKRETTSPSFFSRFKSSICSCLERKTKVAALRSLPSKTPETSAPSNEWQEKFHNYLRTEHSEHFSRFDLILSSLDSLDVQLPAEDHSIAKYSLEVYELTHYLDFVLKQKGNDLFKTKLASLGVHCDAKSSVSLDQVNNLGLFLRDKIRGEVSELTTRGKIQKPQDLQQVQGRWVQARRSVINTYLANFPTAQSNPSEQFKQITDEIHGFFQHSACLDYWGDDVIETKINEQFKTALVSALGGDGASIDMREEYTNGILVEAKRLAFESRNTSLWYMAFCIVVIFLDYVLGNTDPYEKKVSLFPNLLKSCDLFKRVSGKDIFSKECSHPSSWEPTPDYKKYAEKSGRNIIILKDGKVSNVLYTQSNREKKNITAENTIVISKEPKGFSAVLNEGIKKAAIDATRRFSFWGF